MSPRRLLLAACLLPFSLCAVGCGVEAYETRIKVNTIPFLQYQQRLNANLGPRWQKGEVSLRLPAGLEEVPGPKKKEKVPRDPRIPPSLGVNELTGLLGGFRGEVQAVTSGGRTATATFDALVLSNRSLLASRDPKAKPDEWDGVLLNRLSEGLGLGPVPKNALRPYNVGGEGFQPSLRYETAAFETTAGGVPMRYEVYIHEEGRLQVAVVFVVPKNAARPNQFEEPIELSLQTLKIESGGPTTGGAAPQTGGSGPGF